MKSENFPWVLQFFLKKFSPLFPKCVVPYFDSRQSQLHTIKPLHCPKTAHATYFHIFKFSPTKRIENTKNKEKEKIPYDNSHDALKSIPTKHIKANRKYISQRSKKLVYFLNGLCINCINVVFEKYLRDEIGFGCAKSTLLLLFGFSCCQIQQRYHILSNNFPWQQ